MSKAFLSAHVEMMERATYHFVLMSGGALVLSVTLVDKFAPKGLWKGALATAWILFAFSIVSGLGRNWANALANYFIFARSKTEEEGAPSGVSLFLEKQRAGYSLSYRRLELLNQVTFVLGIIFLLLFAIKNLYA